jgi:C-terminal processing protease CtpA/Prc
MKAILILLFLQLAICSFSQQKESTLLQPQQVAQDIDTLITVLRQIHPTFSDYYEKNAINEKIEAFKTSLKGPIRPIDLFRFIQPIITIDGHTSLTSIGKNPNFEECLFPFRVLIYGGELYIKENLSENTAIPDGAIIESINGIPTKKILDELYRFIPGEKVSYKTSKLSREFHTYFWIIYGPSAEFTLKIKDSSNEYQVGSARDKQFQLQKPKFELKFFDKNIAYIYYSKFGPPRDFVHFMDSSFAVIKGRNIKYLIIDNIKNGGGLSDLGDTLASYFTDKTYLKFEKKESKLGPFILESIEKQKPKGRIEGDYFVYDRETVVPQKRKNKFTGLTFIMCSRNSYSSATFFPAGAKCSGTAYIVGEETGQPLLSNGDISPFRLPHSKITGVSALSTYYMPCNNNDRECGLKPDFEVSPTLNDLLTDKNYILDFTLELIRTKKFHTVHINQPQAK